MEMLKECKYSERLIKKLKSLDSKEDLDFGLINKAIVWARKYHEGQLRKSGEPFYSHPLEVAYMISEYKLKTDVIVASILHDIVEDTEVTVGMLLDEFGWRVAEMVDMLTRDRPCGDKLSVEDILDNAFDKEDEVVVLIKLFDRLHNLQTLQYQCSRKLCETLLETISCFLIPIMDLGYQEIEQYMWEWYCKYNRLSSKNIRYNNSSNFKSVPLYSLSPIYQNKK